MTKPVRLFVLALLFSNLIFALLFLFRRSSEDGSQRNVKTFVYSASEFSEPNQPNVLSVKTELLQTMLQSRNDTCQNLHTPLERDVHYRHRYWQVHQEGEEEIVVYSAFHDNRPINGLLSWIRIVGVRRYSTKPLWCYLWYPGFNSPFVTEAEILVTGHRGFNVKGGHKFVGRMYSCLLPTSYPVPSHVSLATRRCVKSNIFLPVERLQKFSKWRHSFGTCLEVNFGYFPPEWIVEWMEMHSLLGVTQVNIYNGSIDKRLDTVFQYYTRKGLLELHQMPPSVEDYSREGILLSSSTSLNDCMLRNMYSNRFVIGVDFDEIIVPRIHKSYSEMIDYIDRSLKLPISHKSYTFRNAYFFQYFPEDESQLTSLKTMRLRQRPKPSPLFFGSKSFVDPRQCKAIFSHYCLIRFINSGLMTIDVNTSVALSHHYRYKCPFNSDKCKSYDDEKTTDDIMLKYKKTLTERVKKVSKEIGLV